MAETNEVKRQFVNFRFFKVLPEWRFLEDKLKERAKEESLNAYQEFSSKVILRSYSTLGVRADCEFMFWRISERLEDFIDMSSQFFKTGFGKYVVPTYSYLCMTKRSSYIDKISPEHGESRTRVVPGKYKYIFVYPFVKSRDWYQFPLPERQAMMDEHIRVGNKYPSVKLNTTYCFGLDDQEFVVAFESDHPKDFLDLVMELRESKASKYTLRDTPTFTCIAKPFKDILENY
ncbi:MAG: chlorite dismutase family protein [Elusimicrobia bacterium]|nr:chlorite dismutase family protein [Elusimicrobiota bacterium]